LDISPLWIPLISKEVSKSKGKLVWSYIVFTYNYRFNSGGSRLVPQMAPLVQVSSST
jgi:hypothetical protein